jgi:hypothetical protein
MTAFVFFSDGIQFFFFPLRFILLLRQPVQPVKQEQVYDRNPPA